LIQDAKLASKFRWLEANMLNVLGDGSEEPNLAAKAVPSEAKTWVDREFREVQTSGDWRRFVESGKHLWVLHAILKAASDKQIFIEALSALAESAEHCQSAPATGKKKAALPANDARWIAKLIKARARRLFFLRITQHDKGRWNFAESLVCHTHAGGVTNIRVISQQIVDLKQGQLLGTTFDDVVCSSTNEIPSFSVTEPDISRMKETIGIEGYRRPLGVVVIAGCHNVAAYADFALDVVALQRLASMLVLEDNLTEFFVGLSGRTDWQITLVTVVERR
jgi:hypothetical protein